MFVVSMLAADDISTPGNGSDEPVLIVRIDLFAEVHDMCLDAFGKLIGIIIPHMFEYVSA